MAKTNSLRSYKKLKEKYPLDNDSLQFYESTKTNIKNIFLKKEEKIVVFVGPCSIHDEKSTLLYAQKLRDLQKDLKNILLVMRVFFEKSRSSNSWRGFLYDPTLDSTSTIEDGIIRVRKLLLELAKLKIPVCSEFLDPNVANYFNDLISWGFIGARTCYSTPHRQLASSLEIPIGFKNPLDGDIKAAINGAIVAKNPQKYVGIDQNGKICEISTQGNAFSHIVLRGSNNFENYDESKIKEVINLMESQKQNFPIVIDCSHGNSKNNCNNQINVFRYIIDNIINKYPLLGIMLESHIKEGKQPLDLLNLRFGLSITDACISFESAKELILLADDTIKTSQHLLR